MENLASDAPADSVGPYWRGNPIEDIYLGLGQFEFKTLPSIVCSDTHAVLFELPIEASDDQPPKPHVGKTRWDSSHVRLPCAAQSTIIIDGEEKQRWDVIETALLQPIRTIEEFEKAVLTYNPKFVGKWSFGGLHDLFDELDETGARNFFDEILPAIVRLALQLPTLLPNAIPLLKHGRSRSVSLSQQQVACLLANAFLCTFPRRNTNSYDSEYGSYPDINFARLFKQRQKDAVHEKVKCIINYFRRVCQKMPTGVITFYRRSKQLQNLPQWSKCEQTFTPAMLMHVTTAGTIEDNGLGLLQVDFANKYLGGGVLGYGCVQEEIRFVICPELLCSMLFTERMEPREAVFMMGCERFSAYDGYASTFHFAGDYVDETPCDEYRRRMCTVVAIDATPFGSRLQQFEPKSLYREIEKAFVGFHHTLRTAAPGVATGNWGCGAFNGDKYLKSLLQMIACCVTNRPMVYFTFADVELCDYIFSMYQFLTANYIKIADLWQWILDFRKYKLSTDQLLDYFMQKYHDLRKASRKSPTKSQTALAPVVLVSTSTASLTKREPRSVPAEENIEEFDSSGDSYFGNVQEPPKDSDSPHQDAQVSSSLVQQLAKASTPCGEAPEKRQRSALLDHLDQSYIEKPSKIQRQSRPLSDYERIIAGDDQAQAAGDSQQSDELVNDQTDKLQSLQVLDESNSQPIKSENGEQSDANGHVDENAEKANTSLEKLDKSQTKIVDFFHRK